MSIGGLWFLFETLLLGVFVIAFGVVILATMPLGIAAWRQTDVSRVGAALLALMPASLVLGALFAVFWIEQFIAVMGPYGLAWLIVGYDISVRSVRG